MATATRHSHLVLNVHAILVSIPFAIVLVELLERFASCYGANNRIDTKRVLLHIEREEMNKRK